MTDMISRLWMPARVRHHLTPAQRVDLYTRINHHLHEALRRRNCQNIKFAEPFFIAAYVDEETGIEYPDIWEYVAIGVLPDAPAP